MAQLRHERQKDDKKHDGHAENHREREDRAHTVVSRVPGGNNTLATSKQASFMTTTSAPLKKQISSTAHEDHHHHHQPIGAQISGGATMISTKKQSVPTEYIEDVPKDDITSVSSATMHSGDYEKQHGHHSNIVRIPQSETKAPLNRQVSNKTSQNSNPDSLKISKVIRHNSSKTSSHIFQSSSINLISKSEILDQDFHLDDPSYTRKNANKNHGKINISGREK